MNTSGEYRTIKLENRESWLRNAVQLIGALFIEQGYEVPQNVNISVGFPSRGGLAPVKKVLGQCWSSHSSQALNFEVFISPLLSDAHMVLGVVIHEIVHAVVGPEAGHRRPFKRCALAIGLVGPMRSTTPGDALSRRLSEISTLLGPYPHSAISYEPQTIPNQTTRLYKVICPSCKYIARIARFWIEVGLPTCPCGSVWVVAPSPIAELLRYLAPSRSTFGAVSNERILPEITSLCPNSVGEMEVTQKELTQRSIMLHKILVDAIREENNGWLGWGEVEARVPGVKPDLEEWLRNGGDCKALHAASQ